jgi:hypothetical protein
VTTNKKPFQIWSIEAPGWGSIHAVVNIGGEIIHPPVTPKKFRGLPLILLRDHLRETFGECKVAKVCDHKIAEGE